MSCTLRLNQSTSGLNAAQAAIDFLHKVMDTASRKSTWFPSHFYILEQLLRSVMC